MAQQQYKGVDRRQTHHSPYQGEERRKGDASMSVQQGQDEQEERTRQQQGKQHDPH